MDLTLTQISSAVSAAAAAWLMLRAGAAKGALTIRTSKACPACGRRRERGRCRCSSGV